MKNKLLPLIIIIMLFLTVGCTKYMSDDDNKKVINPATGQNLTSNILCKPSEKELLDIYEKYDDLLVIPLDELSTCKNFKISDIDYENIWNSIFVKPLAWLIIKIGNFVKNYGLSVMIVGFLIRLLLFPISKKTALQSENMKKAQPEVMKIEKKYKGKNDNDSVMAKSQETMAIYKKYGINPLSSCIFALLQLPIFFAFLEAINRTPAIFEETLWGLQLGTTPLKGITSGNYIYIILIVLIILTTYLSFKYSMGTNKKQDKKNVPTIKDKSNVEVDPQKQTQFMMNFMLIFISIASLSLSTAIGLYWIVTNGFTVVQNLLIKRGMKNDEK